MYPFPTLKSHKAIFLFYKPKHTTQFFCIYHKGENSVLVKILFKWMNIPYNQFPMLKLVRQIELLLIGHKRWFLFHYNPKTWKGPSQSELHICTVPEMFYLTIFPFTHSAFSIHSFAFTVNQTFALTKHSSFTHCVPHSFSLWNSKVKGLIFMTRTKWKGLQVQKETFVLHQKYDYELKSGLSTVKIEKLKSTQHRYQKTGSVVDQITCFFKYGNIFSI